MDQESTNSKVPIFRIDTVFTAPKSHRMQWSKSFDEYLTSLVQKSKNQNWAEISKAMCLRFTDVKFTSKKCRARWKNCINPEISKLYLNDAEELLLIAYHFSYKNKWSKISKHLPNRHSNILRNSFYGAMRKLIQQIVLGKKVTEDITPLMFLQTLYISIFIMELLDLPQVPEHKNPLVPLYIYMYVKEKKIDKKMCEDYVMQYKEQILKNCKTRPSLQALADYSYEKMINTFFTKLVAMIKQRVNSKSFISNEFLYEMFDQALIMSVPTSPVIPSPPIASLQNLPTLPPFNFSTLPSLSPVQPNICMMLGNQIPRQNPFYPMNYMPMMQNLPVPNFQMPSLPIQNCGFMPFGGVRALNG